MPLRGGERGEKTRQTQVQQGEGGESRMKREGMHKMSCNSFDIPFMYFSISGSIHRQGLLANGIQVPHNIVNILSQPLHFLKMPSITASLY